MKSFFLSEVVNIWALKLDSVQETIAVWHPSKQGRDRFADVELVGPTARVAPSRPSGNAKRLVNRGGHVVGCLRIGGRIAADLVGRSDHSSTADPAASEETPTRAAIIGRTVTRWSWPVAATRSDAGSGSIHRIPPVPCLLDADRDRELVSALGLAAIPPFPTGPHDS